LVTSHFILIEALRAIPSGRQICGRWATEMNTSAKDKCNCEGKLLTGDENYYLTGSDSVSIIPDKIGML
jgi:hypothetical protein